MDKKELSETLLNIIENSVFEYNNILHIGCTILESKRDDVPVPFVSFGVDVEDFAINIGFMYKIINIIFCTIFEENFDEFLGGVEITFRKMDGWTRILKISSTKQGFSNFRNLEEQDLYGLSYYPGVAWHIYENDVISSGMQ